LVEVAHLLSALAAALVTRRVATTINVFVMEVNCFILHSLKWNIYPYSELAGRMLQGKAGK